MTDEQREQVTYDYDDETKTTSWSNFPVTLVDRAGVNLADLSDEQRTAALRVLDALLSDEGYATVTGIMGGDEYLHKKQFDRGLPRSVHRGSTDRGISRRDLRQLVRSHHLRHDPG
ncbi:DUF3500 domain-containing protein [Gordonia terrae]|uniref:DUF3500 domain-containing protein n=1 Tax=Gordonia terrae TaxID=2055 RepID=UPI003570F526